MEDSDNKGRLSQKEIEEMVRSNMDLNQFEKEKELLNDLQNQLLRASEATREAKDEVRFLDKLNIFSDSPEEIKRNKTENIEDIYREKVTEKDSQIRKMIREAIPSELKAAWLLKDLQTQLAQIGNSIGSAMNENHKVSSNIRSQNAQLNKLKQSKTGIPKTGPIRMVNTDTLNSHLQNINNASNRANETFSSLLGFLGHRSKDPIQPLSISLEELEDNMMK